MSSSVSSKLTLSLNPEISYSFKSSKKSFGKKEIDDRVKKFACLNSETYNPISHGSRVSEMMGAGLFQHLKERNETVETISREFTKRVIALVNDLRAHSDLRGSTVKLTGEYEKFLNVKMLSKAGFMFKIASAGEAPSPKRKLSLTLNPEIGYSFQDKTEKTSFQKSSIDALVTQFHHLNAETYNPISHGSRVSEMVGGDLFKYLKESRPDANVKQEFTRRVIGLVRDLREQPQFKDSVVEFSGIYKEHLDVEMLSKAGFAYKIVESPLLFQGPFGGTFNRNFLQTLNASQPHQISRQDLDKKDRYWKQFEKNYDAFIQKVETAPAIPQPQFQIPKDAHLIWMGSEPNEDVLQVKESWEKFHPSSKGWKVNLWDDTAAKPLIAEMRLKFPTVGAAWDRAEKWAEKADILRLCIMWKYGGTYIDTDLPCYGSIDEIHAFSEFCVGMERNVHAGGSQIFTGNAWISARPQHPIIEACLKALKPRVDGEDVWSIIDRTGPGVLTREVYKALEKDEDEGTQKTLVMPPSYFYPFHTDMRHIKNPRLAQATVEPWTKGLHLWDTSWV